MLPEMKQATLRIVFTNPFGDSTDITKTVGEGTIGNIFEAVREAIMGCGFAKESVDEWFPEE